MKKLKDVAEAEPKKKKKYLHIIPHSHTDEGWLATTNDTFSGDDENATFTGGVHDILDSVLEQLSKEDKPNRTFSFAQTKGFKTWYDLQSNTTKAKVRELVQSGRLDLVNGGWTTPDEATTQFDSLIDNFMVGQQWLQREFGHHSKVSWSIDALGVSSGYARLAKYVGFDMMVYSKINSYEKASMRKNKTRAQVWRPHEENLGMRKDILGIAMDQQKNGSLGAYCWPQGFYVDQNYLQDVPMVLKKGQEGYHFNKLVKSLYKDVKEYLEKERTPHMMRPFGCDMAYVDAEMNYIITDQLFEMWNELGYNEEIEILYSTPSKYLDAMREVNTEWVAEKGSHVPEEHHGWPIRKEDSFPYSQSNDIFLNGFYSTRPHIKKSVRDATRKLHSSLRLSAQQVLRNDTNATEVEELLKYQFKAMDNLGSLQHHAVMGTVTERVAADFLKKAQNTSELIEKYNSKLLIEKLNYTHNINVSALNSSLGFNLTMTNLSTSYSNNSEFIFTVQNPTPQLREEWIEIQVPYHNYTVSEVF